jgi:hypothetical protein
MLKIPLGKYPFEIIQIGWRVQNIRTDRSGTIVLKEQNHNHISILYDDGHLFSYQLSKKLLSYIGTTAVLIQNEIKYPHTLLLDIVETENINDSD